LTGFPIISNGKFSDVDHDFGWQAAKRDKSVSAGLELSHSSLELRDLSLNEGNREV
jgi:hypothetical protein